MQVKTNNFKLIEFLIKVHNASQQLLSLLLLYKHL